MASPEERSHRSEFERKLHDVVEHDNLSGFGLRTALFGILCGARLVLGMARVDGQLRHREELA